LLATKQLNFKQEVNFFANKTSFIIICTMKILQYLCLFKGIFKSDKFDTFLALFADLTYSKVNIKCILDRFKYIKKKIN